MQDKLTYMVKQQNTHIHYLLRHRLREHKKLQEWNKQHKCMDNQFFQCTFVLTVGDNRGPGGA